MSNRKESKILVVGDTHGDWGYLNTIIDKKRPDIVLQCGDFGWWPKMERENLTLYGNQKTWFVEGVKPASSIVYWCDGNHEDHEDLESKGRQQKHEILSYENVIYKPRGTILKLPDGRIVLFAGGGQSVDKDSRTPGFDWFHQEIPTMNEYERMLGYDHVDIVISHTCPTEWIPGMYRGEKMSDPTRQMLSGVLNKYKPSLWYHGHWHQEASGVSGDTKWFSLDYPAHHGRWWRWLES